MKRLPPTLKERKRYVAFRVESDGPVSQEEIGKAIWLQALFALGEVQAGSLGLRTLEYSEDAREGFLVCKNEGLWKVKAVLALMGEINGSRAHVRVKGVSGTIKALKRKFLNKGPSIIKEKEYDRLMNLTTVRSCGECIDALPEDKELLLRLKDLKMKYIGLIKSDLGGK